MELVGFAVCHLPFAMSKRQLWASERPVGVLGELRATWGKQKATWSKQKAVWGEWKVT